MVEIACTCNTLYSEDEQNQIEELPAGINTLETSNFLGLQEEI